MLLAFDYDGLRRVVAPYVHGSSRAGAESLRAIQVRGASGSRPIASGKLWTVAKMTHLRTTGEAFVPDDPNYNPDDSAMARIHCRIERS